LGTALAQRTVFLDRDGVINRLAPDGGYVTRWQDFEFLPGALEGIRMLRESGHRVVIVTNQRGVARGHMTAMDLAVIHGHMLDEIERAGGGRPRVYACTHDVGTCTCRKPLPGLFLRARSDDPGIDFSRSIVVGDGPADLQAAAAIGCPAILIAPGGRRSESNELAGAERIKDSLLEAARSLG
jgi:histidinol-phosphate phosphatase family protein